MVAAAEWAASDANAQRRVVVTGGSGFVGSHLTRRLIRAGHRVTVVDDLSTGRAAHLSDLVDHPRLQVLRHDVVHPLQLETDLIFHLACPASPVDYQRDPVKTIQTCVAGSTTVLELARRSGATVLLASTSEVYGDPITHPQCETDWGNVNPIGVRSCYDEGKRCAEALFAAYQRQYGVPTRVARIFNTYGPGMRPDDGRVVSNFVVAALRGEPLVIAGDGAQTRSFCYVDDLVDGLTRLMAAPEVTGPINLGNPEEISIGNFAELVLRVVGGRSEVVYGPRPTDDPARRRPDIAAARMRLGWQPTTSLADGVARTAAWFRSSGRWRTAA